MEMQKEIRDPTLELLLGNPLINIGDKPYKSESVMAEATLYCAPQSECRYGCTCVSYDPHPNCTLFS